MAAEKQLRRLVHGFGVERRPDMPGAAAIDRERRAPVDDAIAIGAAARRPAGVEIVGNALDAEHGDRRRPHMVVEGADYLERLIRPPEIEMGGLADRVDAGIGTAGAVDDDRLAAEALDGGFQDFLHR